MLERQKSALVVVDLQNDFTLETGKAHACVSQVNKLFPIVNQLSKKFIATEQEVVYLKTEWSNPFVKLLTGNSVKKGTTGADFDSRLKVVSNNVFIKGNKNAFASDDFRRFLQDKSIAHLYLVGLATDYCIKVSAIRAIAQGYKVTVVRDGVAGYRCEDFLLSLYILVSRNVAVEESANI